MRQPTFVVGAFLLCVALVFGGGGWPSPESELVVHFGSVVALIAWAVLARQAPTNIDRTFWLLAAALIALPLAQLVPLPPSLWQALPGRETEANALALAGDAARWMPLSLHPGRTLSAALALVPPLVMAWLTSQMSPAERTKLLVVVAIVGLASVMIGAFQLIGARSGWSSFYEHAAIGFLHGFQANRNAAADLLLIAVLAVPAYARLRPDVFERPGARMLAGGVYALMLLGMVLTGSRTGLALGVLVLAATPLILRPHLIGARTLLLAGLAAIALAGTAGWVMKDNPRIANVIDRFDLQGRSRPELWRDTAFLVDRYWPVGSGVGTFATVMPTAERLELVDEGYPNRAHNDVLEFLLEGGIAAVAIMLACLTFVAVRVYAMLRSGRTVPIVHGVFALAAFGILALHSLVDYPMRSLSLACLAAFAAGLLARAPASRTMAAGSPAKPGRLGESL